MIPAAICTLLVAGVCYSDPPVDSKTGGSSTQPLLVTINSVHHGLGLVDIAGQPGGPTAMIEAGSGDQVAWSAQLPLDGRAFRAQLLPGQSVRFRAPDGAPGVWLDARSAAVSNPAALQTPSWALGAVWYNIFPERFDNGNPGNDQGWPHGTRLPWTQDWFEVTADEFESSANRAIAFAPRYTDDGSRQRPPLHDTVFERRFGGDLQGVERRLDHIRQLGATVIWFCPIFDSTSLHKYDAADHRHIDPALGHPGTPDRGDRTFAADPEAWEWTPADRYFVDRFLPAAKSRGLRVVLDGVWNHVGLAHPTFQSVLSQGNDSPYASWYHFGVGATGRVNTWQAWDRVNGGLPEFRQTEGDLVPGVREHVFDVTRRWMDPNGDGEPDDGIDGWRLDVANEVGLAFWSAWRAHVRSINPEATLVGELWFDAREYFEGKAFDAQMNYPLAYPLIEWLGGSDTMTTERLLPELDRVFSHEAATDLAQVNLLGSHDTARFVSKMMNPILDYDRGAGLSDSGYDRGEPDADAYAKLELAYAVLTALPGSPMVYAGDELGLWGADDPENRKPLVWPGDQHLAERIGSLLRLRQDAEVGRVLRFGASRWWAEGAVLFVERQLGPTRVRLAANPTERAVTFSGGEIAGFSYRIARIDSDGSEQEVAFPDGGVR